MLLMFDPMTAVAGMTLEGWPPFNRFCKRVGRRFRDCETGLTFLQNQLSHA